MTIKRLSKGLIVCNTSTGSKGVIIDWGVKKKHRSYLPLPAYNKMAEEVRVWTSSAIEIWLIDVVSLGKEKE